MRNIKYKNGYCYHVFNRGVDRRVIFNDQYDYQRFLLGAVKFNTDKSIGGLYQNDRGLDLSKGAGKIDYFMNNKTNLVDVICYCLNRNHYHFILRQKIDDGISKFMHKIDMGYTNFFNIKNIRSGSLLEGPYKSVYIKSIEQLIYLSAYINGNAEIHGISQAKDWAWSSYHDYSVIYDNKFLKRSIILDEFKSIGEYVEYMKTVIAEAKKRKKELRELNLE